jgi:hypothetical protein
MTAKTPVDPCPACGSTDPDERYCAGTRPQVSDDAVVERLEWTDKHGLSLGGSSRGVHEASKIGYWVHDSLGATNTRFRVQRMGVDKPIAKARTLEAAKRAAQADFERSIRSALSATNSEAVSELAVADIADEVAIVLRPYLRGLNARVSHERVLSLATIATQTALAKLGSRAP